MISDSCPGSDGANVPTPARREPPGLPEPGHTRYRAVVAFDLDHTLVHSDLDLRRMAREVASTLRDAGVPGISDPPPITSRLVALAREWDRHHGTQLEQAAWSIAERHERAALERARVEPEVPRVLAALRRRGCWLAIWTNNTRATTEAVLGRFRLARWFAAVATRDDVAALKPAPDGLARIRQRLGPPAAALPTYVVGDSWVDGMAAANAGVPFIAFRPDPGALADHGVRPVRSIVRLDELLVVVAP